MRGRSEGAETSVKTLEKFGCAGRREDEAGEGAVGEAFFSFSRRGTCLQKKREREGESLTI